ncbi:peptidase M20 [Coccomyxa subellipsoidea C-169]|uniref:Peptidase M20 n=1 Tax=Coccomyxa subellipsoidea (strain C-169) TaxID=574566 RepID=I0YQZ9_COCSC|nr:peptidase M20 [Coccomyxa subellipsoidea C-169]EIE20818.1 peptidase M20 [Coccomyxa subellipsoidea C-169]|eukprot:XP_005645362.1 peptidase M20 [Coccomyxa subellipsoidea C-169]
MWPAVTFTATAIALISTIVIHFQDQTSDPVAKFASQNLKKYDDDLIQLAKIASISSLPEHNADILKAAEWLVPRLKAAELEDVRILQTKGQPAVYGQWLHAAGAPTVLIYGHYDVQPVDPLELWTSPPFNPTVTRTGKGQGYFRGRGVSDDKGGLLQPVQAVEAYLKTKKALPVNVKFLLEGQEEIGSPNLAELLAEHKELLAADMALSADGGQISETQAGVVLGLRGGVAFEVEAQTVGQDLHSGLKGGSVQNPIHALAQFVADLHAPNGSVAVDGFYDLLDVVCVEQRVNARRWLRPTLEVVGIYGGFSGVGIKTIVPSKATAKISCRLVPDQDPDHVMSALKRHVDTHAPAQTRLTFTPLPFRAHPYIMPRDTVANRAAAKVLGGLFGTVKFYRDGGSIPALALFKEHLNLFMTCFSFGLPDDNIHSPNERFRVSMYDKGREAWIRMLQEIANQAASA